MSEWMDIASAPKSGAYILAISDAYCDGKIPLMLRWHTYNGKAGWRDWDADLHFPKVWQPLPAPPDTRKE